MQISRRPVFGSRKRVSILAALVGLLLPAGPCLGQTLFSDDFSDGVITGWTDIGTDPMEESGGIFQTPDGVNLDSHYSVDAGAAWTDYTFSADVMANDDDMCGITFRIQDGSNYYLLRQTFGDTSYGTWNLVLQKVVGGSATDLASPIDNEGSNPGQVDSETEWYTFKVEVSGTSIKAYIDDVLKFDITDSTYASGTVGLYLEADRDGQFDNALVVSAGTPLTVSSAADQTFFVSDAPTAVSTVTITDADPASITATNDIRIRIPAGFNMVWDSSDTTAAIGGAASSKVSPTVSYEDSDATLVLNVTSNFAASDVITVSGLSFTSFTAASTSDNLELEVNNDDVVSATDDKTVQIKGPTFRSIGTDSGVLYSYGTASSTAGSSVVTFAGGAVLPTNVGLGDKLTIGSGSSTLFSDDFNDGVITGWTDIGTDALEETGGVIRNASGGNADSHYSIDAGVAWTDYAYSIEHLADDDDISGFTFRISDADNYYLVTQGFGDNDAWNLRLQKVVSGSATDLTTAINNQGGALGQVNSETTWYTFKAEVNGTSIKVYVDDVLKFDITDSTYSTGTAGLWLSGQTEFSRFDNALVTGAGSAEHYVLSRDSDTQVTLQATAGSTVTNETYTFERCYNTMQAWEDDSQGDLVTDGRRAIGVCYNDGAFTDRLVISGSTTDAAHYMKLTVAEGQRHNGLKNTGAMIDAQGGWTNQNAIDVEDEYTWIDGLEIKAIHDGGSGVFFDDSPAADNGLASNIFVHAFWQAGNAGVEIGAQNVTVRNSFFTGGTTYGIVLLTNSSASIENCTIYGFAGSGSGIGDQAGTTISIKNTISVNHGAGVDFQLWSTISYFGNNMFSAVTGFDPAVQDGGNQLPPANLEYLFVDLSTDDFHLESSGHRAGNAGLSLSSSFSDDIDGDSRSGTWDIGADEGVSGTVPLTPKIIAWQEVEP